MAPSPQLTVTLRIALPLVAAGVTTKLNVAGSPEVGRRGGRRDDEPWRSGNVNRHGA